jgi:class 3 adenylate cyclase
VKLGIVRSVKAGRADSPAGTVTLLFTDIEGSSDGNQYLQGARRP